MTLRAARGAAPAHTVYWASAWGVGDINFAAVFAFICA
jgi:hypothetical protein